MEEFIVFMNKNCEGVIVEGSFEWEYADFEVRNTTTVDESLLEADGWGVTERLDMKKAFKPLKFYRVKWWEEDLSTEDGHTYTAILEEFEEIDYINQ